MWQRLENGLLVVLLGIAAAVLYGIVHDQITARLCVEYFTIGHPRLIASESPTLLGLLWGVIATWWAGLLVGLGAAVASQAGRRPPFAPRRLLRPIGLLLAIMASLALTAGVVGYQLANHGWIQLVEPLASRVPRSQHTAFLTAGAAHLASYAGGFLGGIALCSWIWGVRILEAVAARRQSAARAATSAKKNEDREGRNTD